MFKCRQLLGLAQRVTLHAGKLRRVEGQQRAGARGVAEDALAAGRDVIVELPRALCRGHRQGHVAPRGRHQLCVGLLRVPSVAVRVPVATVVVQNLRLDALPWRVGGVALGEHDGLADHAVGREPPLTLDVSQRQVGLVVLVKLRALRQREEPFARRAVGPGLGHNRIRQHARRKLVFRNCRIESRLAQAAREGLCLLGLGGRLQRVERAALMIDQVEFPLLIDAEHDDGQRRGAELLQA